MPFWRVFEVFVLKRSDAGKDLIEYNVSLGGSVFIGSASNSGGNQTSIVNGHSTVVNFFRLLLC